MKQIITTRKEQKKPLIKKYDSFDSIMRVINQGEIIKIVPYVNTDFRNGYNGGILECGHYWFICGLRNNGQKVLFLLDLKYMNQVNKLSDMTEEMRILPSSIPNPNHGGKKIITQVLVHADGPDGGYSHGCQTVYPDYWKDFIDLFSIDETGIYTLI